MGINAISANEINDNDLNGIDSTDVIGIDSVENTNEISSDIIEDQEENLESDDLSDKMKIMKIVVLQIQILMILLLI